MDEIRPPGARAHCSPGAVTESNDERVSAGLLDHRRQVVSIRLEVIGPAAARSAQATLIVSQYPMILREVLDDGAEGDRRLERHRGDRHQRSLPAFDPPLDLGPVWER